MSIIEVYDMINYIRRYISNNDINNYAYFPYFDYENLLYVLSNALKGATIVDNIILVNFHKIFIIKQDNLYEILIELNDLIEPVGPI
jgi:hypothetical protein